MFLNFKINITEERAEEENGTSKMFICMNYLNKIYNNRINFEIQILDMDINLYA